MRRFVFHVFGAMALAACTPPSNQKLGVSGPLTLRRTVTYLTAPTVALTHRVTVHTRGDTLVFSSIVRNVSQVSLNITVLCYPSAYAPPVLVDPHDGQIGPACYGGSHTLPPGGSVDVESLAMASGFPGRYHVRVHAIDPDSADAEIDLDLVAR